MHSFYPQRYLRNAASHTGNGQGARRCCFNPRARDIVLYLFLFATFESTAMIVKTAIMEKAKA